MVIKQCSCGRALTRDDWEALEHLPDWDLGEGEVQQVRNCSCGSTLVIDREDAVDPSSEPTSGIRRSAASRAVVADALARFGLKGLAGRARERVRFMRTEDVDPEVRAVRLFHRSVMGTGLELEEVLHYRRRLTLTAADHAAMPPGFGIREILRLNTHALTRRLDDPLDEVSFYDAPTGAFRRDNLPKVYHANLVLKVSAAHAREHWLSRYRMVLNQDGLVRVEPVMTRSSRAKTPR